jgi:hypothetical protein
VTRDDRRNMGMLFALCMDSAGSVATTLATTPVLVAS